MLQYQKYSVSYILLLANYTHTLFVLIILRSNVRFT